MDMKQNQSYVLEKKPYIIWKIKKNDKIQNGRACLKKLYISAQKKKNRNKKNTKIFAISWKSLAWAFI